ncbi:MAG: hypothetical protein IT381_27185 [Deltaproteobacteria bacterium]|nr:hypothetical protein [Deltaproteobacteria bacterium]
MIALVLVLAAVNPDEVPLLAPIVDPVAAVSAEAPRGRRDARVFHVGVRAAGFVQSGVQRGGTLGVVELSVRFPFAGHRLGLMLAPSFAGAFGSDATTATQAFVIGVPLELTYHEALGPGHLRVHGGPSFDWSSAFTRAGTVSVADQVIGFGAIAGAGYLLDAGPGKVIFDLSYRYLSYVVGNVPQASHGGSFGLGYAFWL